MTRIEQWLSHELGLRMASIGAGTAARAVQDRMRVLRITEEADYCTRLGADPTEAQTLTERLVVAESWFFRNPESFHALRGLAEAHPGGPFRVLSVPCASGEEPYSIAMTLKEAGLRRDQIRIDAVDISRLALARAATGLYSGNAFREPLFGEQQQKHFARTSGGHLLAPTIRSLVSFAHGNLASESFLPRENCYDVIFLRNFLIYLDDAAQRGVLRRLRTLLAQNGHLFLGPAESLLATSEGFHPADFPMAFVCRRWDEPTRVLQEVPPQPLPSAKALPRGDRARALARPHTAPATSTVSTPAATTPLPFGEVQRLADAGELVAALEAARAFVARYDTSAEGWYTLALVYDAMALREPAVECYRKVRFLDPDHLEAGLLLKLCRQSTGSVIPGAGQ
ncbi:MAG: protein-glutamate O-methyltransferase CheR [Gemmatimonadales bacterium]